MQHDGRGVGAFLAGLVITPLLGGSTINQGNFSLSGLLISLLGIRAFSTTSATESSRSV